MKNILFLFLLIIASLIYPDDSVLQFKKKIPLPGVTGRIDHMDFDARNQRLFVCALGNNTLEIIDINSGKILKSIGGLSEPQGVAYVPEYNKIYVNNGGNGKCIVFDGTTYQGLTFIEFKSGDADNIRYDGASHTLFIGYGEGRIAAVDAKTDTVLYKIPLAGHPETFALEKDGNKLYVNVPRFDRSVVIIDRTEKKIIQKWIIGNLSSNLYSNFPISLDEAHHRLFVGTFIRSDQCAEIRPKRCYH